MSLGIQPPEQMPADEVKVDNHLKLSIVCGSNALRTQTNYNCQRNP
ncbi:MAG: hypothetical protein ACI9G1_002440, partial [Pirellulaceae bacterium]